MDQQVSHKWVQKNGPTARPTLPRGLDLQYYPSVALKYSIHIRLLVKTQITHAICSIETDIQWKLRKNVRMMVSRVIRQVRRQTELLGIK